jgi:ribulose bisphosphate carboxylase small subunit
MARKGRRKIAPTHIKQGFHSQYVGCSSKEIKEALDEVINCLKDLEEEKVELISMLKKAQQREMVKSVMRKDMNPSRKDICRPGRGRRGGWLVQGGFMDGHGKSDGWGKG